LLQVKWDSTQLTRLVLDGWFPLLPWLSVLLAGYIFGGAKLEAQYNHLFIFSSCVLFAVYAISFYLTEQIQPLRNNYSELFYPINFHYLTYLLAITFALIYLINSDAVKINILAKLGQYSLSIYLLHTILIKFIFTYLSPSLDGMKWPYNLVLLLAIYFITIIYSMHADRIKKTFNGRYSKVLTFLIGL
jgi:peptidoglycan/LPS O-acetylase OafA/YrhL